MNLSSVSAQIVRKTKVEFFSSDSVLITADHYYSRKENPYILLFHTEKSSRGEFDSLAYRFVKMQYNCLAVDLRTGDKYGFVHNETAERVHEGGLDIDTDNAEEDIIAAINFVSSFNGKPIVLLGSSSSASLCVKIASRNPKVKAVMAFSPGEFFLPEFKLASVLPGMKTPLFIAGNPEEQPYINEIFSDLNDQYKSFMPPPDHALGRGARLLLMGNPARDEYWLAVLIFIKSIKTLPDGEVSDNPV